MLYSEARAKHWLKAGPQASLTQSNADFLPLKIQAYGIELRSAVVTEPTLKPNRAYSVPSILVNKQLILCYNVA